MLVSGLDGLNYRHISTVHLKLKPLLRKHSVDTYLHVGLLRHVRAVLLRHTRPLLLLRVCGLLGLRCIHHVR